MMNLHSYKLYTSDTLKKVTCKSLVFLRRLTCTITEVVLQVDN